MGFNAFLKNPGPRLVQALLFTLFVFLFCCPRADALICRNCVSLWTLSPCIPLDNFCITSDGVCFFLEVHGSKRLEKRILNCLEKDKEKCGSQWEDAKTHLRYELSCCSHENLCNWKRYIRPWTNFNNPENTEEENRYPPDTLINQNPANHIPSSTAS